MAARKVSEPEGFYGKASRPSDILNILNICCEGCTHP